ncbi:MAG: hypothetical protein AAFN04_06715 [Pseudomonadota bacterium]
MLAFVGLTRANNFVAIDRVLEKMEQAPTPERDTTSMRATGSFLHFGPDALVGKWTGIGQSGFDLPIKENPPSAHDRF